MTETLPTVTIDSAVGEVTLKVSNGAHEYDRVTPRLVANTVEVTANRIQYMMRPVFDCYYSTRGLEKVRVCPLNLRRVDGGHPTDNASSKLWRAMREAAAAINEPEVFAKVWEYACRDSADTLRYQRSKLIAEAARKADEAARRVEQAKQAPVLQG